VNDLCFRDGEISTDRLYPILVLSGLPKETLGQIWSLANQKTPGQLIKPELYLLLALIAFAQVCPCQMMYLSVYTYLTFIDKFNIYLYHI
jgi:hypothetical protein